MKIFSKLDDVIGIIREKEIFNEIGFLYKLPVFTSLVATEDTILAVIDKNLVETLSKTDPSLKKIFVGNILLSLKNKAETLELTAK